MGYFDWGNEPWKIIAESMQAHCARDSKSRGANYESIAKKYVLSTTAALMSGDAGEQEGERYIWLKDLQLANNARYAKNGVKQLSWYKWLRENYSMFTVLNASHKDSKIPSKVITSLDHNTLLRLFTLDPEQCAQYLQSETTHTGKTVQTPIDLHSLSNFVCNERMRAEWQQLDPPKNMPTNEFKKLQERRLQNVVIGTSIYAQCELTGIFTQSVSESEWPREFLTGLNLQNCRRELREAALGKCYKYDINSSAFAYRATVIRQYRPHYPLTATMQLLNHKHAVRNQLVYDVMKNTKASKKFKTNLIKLALTSIGFGSDPNNTKGALSDIIYDFSDRVRFQNNPWVKQFRAEQKQFDEIMREQIHKDSIQQHAPHLLKNGRFNAAKVSAFLYQQFETEFMQRIMQQLGEQNILLWVHDCVYSTTKIDVMQLNYMAQDMGYPLIKFEKTDIAAVKYNVLAHYDDEIQRIQHHQRIAREEMAARNYVNINVDTSTGNAYNNHINYPKTVEIDQLQQEWEQTQQQNLRALNPIYSRD